MSTISKRIKHRNLKQVINQNSKVLLIKTLTYFTNKPINKVTADNKDVVKENKSQRKTSTQSTTISADTDYSYKLRKLRRLIQRIQHTRQSDDT